MARGSQDSGPLPAQLEFDALTVDDLRPLAAMLVSDPPKRKGELVAVVVGAMTDPARVRKLYDQLEPLAQFAVREATHDPDGIYSEIAFEARHGQEPSWSVSSGKSNSSWSESRRSRPTPLVLFFPKYNFLPTDVRKILLTFVPPPDPFRIKTSTESPTTHSLPQSSWGQREPEKPEPVRIRETAREAEADLAAILRLIDAGKVRVTDKKQTPTDASRKAVAGALTGGDFYTPEDGKEYDDEPPQDLAIKAFAWPMLVQAAGLAEKRGEILKLTTAGREALSKAPATTLKKIWSAWVKTTLLDEFSRVEAIKGQGKARLSAVANRRGVILEAIKDCPPGEWFKIDDFWRFLHATEREFAMTAGDGGYWDLYLCEKGYGSFANSHGDTWQQIQGRYILAFLFEYAATTGLLDVAHISPRGARDDYRDRWGADDLPYLSRYDGLLSVRINALGAWCLGLAEGYRPTAPQVTDNLRVLANLDVVATQPPPVADRLTLERFADETSPMVWKLSGEKIRGVVEQGGRVDELTEFLATRMAGEIPPAVETFLSDLRRKVELLKDGGPARLIECADAHVAAVLVNDRQLKGKCLLAGDRTLVVPETDLAAVRKAVRRLGYVWPIPGE